MNAVLSSYLVQTWGGGEGDVCGFALTVSSLHSQFWAWRWHSWLETGILKMFNYSYWWRGYRTQWVSIPTEEKSALHTNWSGWASHGVVVSEAHRPCFGAKRTSPTPSILSWLFNLRATSNSVEDPSKSQSKREYGWETLSSVKWWG